MIAIRALSPCSAKPLLFNGVHTIIVTQFGTRWQPMLWVSPARHIRQSSLTGGPTGQGRRSRLRLRRALERRHLPAEPRRRRMPADRCCRVWLGTNASISMLGLAASPHGVAAMTGAADGITPKPPSAGNSIERSLDALFRKEEPGLRRYFRHRLRSDDEALDYVQEVFARLIAAMRGGAPAQPAAYLRRIAMNLLIDRSRCGRPVHCEISVEIAVPPEQEDALLAGDLMATYKAALDAMTDRTRTIFLLYRVHGLKYREIAERLGISIPAVQKHVARALERITLALNDRE